MTTKGTDGQVIYDLVIKVGSTGFAIEGEAQTLEPSRVRRTPGKMNVAAMLDNLNLAIDDALRQLAQRCYAPRYFSVQIVTIDELYRAMILNGGKTAMERALSMTIRTKLNRFHSAFAVLPGEGPSEDRRIK